jgi:murein DD-endopeptidase MepM/ murein hydrolase activator NlpD
MKVLVGSLVGGAALAASTAALLPLAMMTSMGVSDVALAPVSSCTVDASGLTVDDLDSEQLKNAATIIGVAVSLKVPPRGQAIAIATAMQESGLRNLDYGDRDSLGLFQQRPSQGWGSPSEVRDPARAARGFFGGPTSPVKNGGLLSVKGWQDMELWEAAQAVQRSGFPTAYAKWEGLANDVVTELSGATSTCEPLAAGNWTLPISTGYTLTSGFGSRVHPITGEVRFHAGLDMAAPTGTPVRAAAAGEVTWAGVVSGYGNLVRIRHAGNVETYYGHLSAFVVRAGQQVQAGDLIGKVGSTGNSTGPHLHFEVRHNGEPTNPDPFLREKGLKP